MKKDVKVRLMAEQEQLLVAARH